MTLFEITLGILFAPVIILFGVVTATILWLMFYGSWLWLLAALGSQWALERWRNL
jgi:hypothetical protein